MPNPVPAMTESEVPLYERPEIYERRWFLLGVMCLCLAMVVMSVSGLNVAIPQIQASLNATATDLQWIIDSYTIIFAGMLLTAGAIGDRFGRKRALQGGLILFALGSVVGVLASSVTVLIIARSVMGFGAAFIMPATLSILSAIFGPEERPKAIAIWAGFAGAGGALGPVVVGFLLTDWWISPSYWWGAAFVVSFIGAAVVLIVVSIYTPRSRDDAATKLDPVGAVLSFFGLAALLYGIIEGPVKGWSSTEVMIAFVVAVVCLLGFVFWELRLKHPMLPMDLFRNDGFSIGSGVITFAFFVMFGFFFLITQFLQFVRGYSPLEAGIATMPMAVPIVLVSPRSVAISARIGAAAVIAAGFAFLVAGFAVLAIVDTSTAYWVIAAALVLLGIGMGITVAPATASIMEAVPLNRAGIGSAVNDTTREVGGALGIAVFGSIVNSAYRSEIDADALSALPPEAAAAASESVGAATYIAAQLPAEIGGRLSAAAGDAYTTAFGTSMNSAAVIAAVAGAVLYFVGRRSSLAKPAPEVKTEISDTTP